MWTGLTIAFVMGLAVLVAKVKPGPRKTSPKIDPAVVARLGPELGAWYMATRGLIATLEHLYAVANERLSHEREFAESPRNLKRMTLDANFLEEVRKVRDTSRRWVETAHGLSESASRRLRERGLDPSTVMALDLPWDLARECDNKRDRSDEIERIIDELRHAAAAIVEIDRRLTSIRGSAYR
jgi:hypothetical protein